MEVSTAGRAGSKSRVVVNAKPSGGDVYEKMGVDLSSSQRHKVSQDGIELGSG
jgi:hypothetical protein